MRVAAAISRKPRLQKREEARMGQNLDQMDAGLYAAALRFL